MSYDVFLSYRREAGSAEARVLQSSLQSRGKQCFLDATQTADASTLLQQIAQIPSFLVILHPGTLDQFAEMDWLRLEICEALRSGRKIIPVMLPGFVYPQNLPEDIRAIASYPGIEYNLRALDSMLAGIVSSIDSPQPQYVTPAPPPITSAPFNWMLAGLLFLALGLPTIPSSIIGSHLGMETLRRLGYTSMDALVTAGVTAIVWQRVRSPIAISALCGLSQFASSFVMGTLFFASFRMYALGIFSFLFGALVIGSIGLARMPRFPRSALWSGPLGGVVIYLALGSLAGVPGFKPGWQILSLPISAALMGAAFYLAIPPQEMAAKT